MPRQRMIKPEFFDSESLALCSIEARLAFIGLWVMGDDFGNQKAQLFRLRHHIFPYDNMDDSRFLDILCELEETGCIKGYEIDGERFITVPNFKVYQSVRKPSATNIPEPPKSTLSAKTTKVIQRWRTGTTLVAPDSDSTTLVQHECATSNTERKKEGKKEVVVLRQQQLPSGCNGESASVGAAVADATPPSAPTAPICPLCSSPVRFDAHDGVWRCDLCGDVKEPAYREVEKR